MEKWNGVTGKQNRGGFDIPDTTHPEEVLIDFSAKDDDIPSEYP